MCEGTGQPASVTEALGMLHRALDHLTAADAASLPSSVQAEALRALERAGAKHTAARSRVLAAFAGQAAYEDDGQGSARAWLRWQTRVTTGAAAGAVGWVRRLGDHPVIADALAAGDLSESWARQICAWTDRLPPARQDDADEILAAAARGGVDLAGLAGLAQEMYERAHRDRDESVPDGFGDRAVFLGTTLGGAGRLSGDLTAGCSAALAAVLDSLGKWAGPGDIRTATQRRHDALEEACRRLIAAGMLPDRAGQPTQVQLHMTLSQLRDAQGASAAEAAWAAARATQTGWVTGPAADAAACDATVVPIVTGHVDWTALDRLTGIYLACHGRQPDGGAHCGCTCGGCTCSARQPLPAQTMDRLRRTLLHVAADVLSGPAGLAAWLRTSQLTGTPGGVAGFGASPSLPLAVPLPLDIGEAEPTIPAHLRRAVLARHQHCTYPGCRVPAAFCQIHHYIPRARGGPTALGNLGPVCVFHHQTVVHRWGWTLTLHPAGEVTATSPDGTRTLHDHDPPSQAA
ncbi:MAG TPA: DUF222 domain-containing protein [Streptosporangiaceae bacterium]|nr:DUF222 domain-containing protein [Streptosporangiaceae bacterium]